MRHALPMGVLPGWSDLSQSEVLKQMDGEVGFDILLGTLNHCIEEVKRIRARIDAMEKVVEAAQVLREDWSRVGMSSPEKQTHRYVKECALADAVDTYSNSSIEPTEVLDCGCVVDRGWRTHSCTPVNSSD